MDERLESWIAAERLIAHYGPAAEDVARRHAESQREQGKPDSAETWTLIENLIRQLQAGHSPASDPR